MMQQSQATSNRGQDYKEQHLKRKIKTEKNETRS